MRLQEEALEALRQERLRKEEEEYKAWRGQIEIEEAGLGVNEEAEAQLNSEIRDHILEEKIVYIEGIAALFGLKTSVRSCGGF